MHRPLPQPVCCVPAPSPRPPSVTLYGSIDQYLNYMKSSSGTSLTSLNDGSSLRSRVGFKGSEDLGNGLTAKFQLEHGLSADSGAQADSSRFFDRQGLGGPGHALWRIPPGSPERHRVRTR